MELLARAVFFLLGLAFILFRQPLAEFFAESQPDFIKRIHGGKERMIRMNRILLPVMGVGGIAFAVLLR